MAIANSSSFIADVWSKELLTSYKEHLTMSAMKGIHTRSKGAQLLRDAALGHPEYPERNITAAEVAQRLQEFNDEYTNHAAAAIAHNLDSSILASISVERQTAKK